jgi:hypothetical protein
MPGRGHRGFDGRGAIGPEVALERVRPEGSGHGVGGIEDGGVHDRQIPGLERGIEWRRRRGRQRRGIPVEHDVAGGLGRAAAQDGHARETDGDNRRRAQALQVRSRLLHGQHLGKRRVW